MDLGVLTLRPQDHARGLEMAGTNRYSTPIFEVSDPVVVEWRALTVALLDRVHQIICDKLGVPKESFSLAKSP